MGSGTLSQIIVAFVSFSILLFRIAYAQDIRLKALALHIKHPPPTRCIYAITAPLHMHNAQCQESKQVSIWQRQALTSRPDMNPTYAVFLRFAHPSQPTWCFSHLSQHQEYMGTCIILHMVNIEI